MACHVCARYKQNGGGRVIRCRECEACSHTPCVDELTCVEYYAFGCDVENGRDIAIGLDVSALPKTSPRWCPLRQRKENENG
jgi:hypothetical protein